MVKLPLFRPALYDILKFARIVPFRRIFRHVKMRFNDISDIPKHHRSTLLYALGRCKIQLASALLHNCARLSGIKLVLYFVAPYIGETDRCADIYTVYLPPQPRMPVYGLQYAAGGGRRHNVIADALHFHLGAVKRRIIAPYLDLYRQYLMPPSLFI